ncbi:hypothetical protein [Streptomyces sp. HUAS TT20]|nr:hypothetical protein [Streptomyces sp. HUAS 15-9]UXY25503.1 hypothetical protein N8I87_02265 [Streptomyces sp. HUAS 15-9]
MEAGYLEAGYLEAGVRAVAAGFRPGPGSGSYGTIGWKEGRR